MLGNRGQRLKALLKQTNKVYIDTTESLTIEDVTKEPKEHAVVQELDPVVTEEVVIPEESKKELPPLSDSAIQNLICPISMEIMRDPVTNRCGYTFEREAIIGWLKSKHTCPISRTPMCQAELIPNKSLKIAIMWYHHHNLLPLPSSAPKVSGEDNDEETCRYNLGRLPPIDIPEHPDLSFLDASDRRMIESAYRVMNSLGAWDYLRRYSPSRSSGYTFDLGINRIMNKIQDEYDLHSGASIAYTMRRIEFIAKNGLSFFRQQYMEANSN